MILDMRQSHCIALAKSCMQDKQGICHWGNVEKRALQRSACEKTVSVLIAEAYASRF
jgi:hypothetical protein